MAPHSATPTETKMIQGVCLAIERCARVYPGSELRPPCAGEAAKNPPGRGEIMKALSGSAQRCEAWVLKAREIADSLSLSFGGGDTRH